ncbi:E4 SUMO-protein ligase PIAL2 isoform X1 [Daucus carota subsp. sativus]|uniref:E4 SUMO-protein ligase PIAL2 isoform X1 n=1 Tax=Daucus carota subsp. sativus TaxID=79200 RepID=UPI0007EF07DD|nr:PREDICTED: E4 SUMO-protein ligase PIAL2-like isoform X1 [Daucus carota subsp. sativus]
MEAPRRSSGKNSVSSQLIGAAVDLLALYNNSGKLNDPRLLSKLCITMTRGIDHAIANNEVPIKSRELPTLLQKINVWKHDLSVVIPFMLLMMSVKNACQNGWFQKKETDDLLALANEVKRFFSTDDVLQGPCHALPSISQILSRYYPRLKIENTLCFTEVKPGYRTIVADFNLSRGVVASMREMIGMIVVRVDAIDTSSCIITPQEVDILLNGKGVLGRNNTSMEPVPLVPTDVTAMLKYGVNLLQAIGNFNGPYIIAIAVMCVIPTSGTPQLQDYVQPVVASGDTASTDMEMALQTSLNCPISKNRMRTPIKGHLCKHMQCFDYDSYLSINSRRPCWRCPLCDEPVSCIDIRIDQNIAKVLREVEEDTDHVLVSKDGSWKVVSEIIDPSFGSASKTPEFREEKQNQSNPIGKNLSRDENYSQQISPTTNVEPSRVSMHQNTSNSSSLAANCTNLNDQGKKNSRVTGTNSNGMSIAMSPIIDCRGCHSLQKDTELRKQSSWSCINTSSSANPLSVQGSVSQVNSLPVQNSNAYILPTVEQNGYCQNSRDTHTYQNSKNSSNNVCEAVHVQQVHSQRDDEIQASLNTHNRQPSVLDTCSKQSRPESEQKQNMHREKNQVSHEGGLVELPSEGWRPSGRMRGSLQGQAYAEAYRRFIKQPTQPVGASELPSRLMATLSVAKSQRPNIKASAQATNQ